MELVSYRLVKERHAQTAFDGEGAGLFGGRWNSRGIPLVEGVLYNLCRSMLQGATRK